MEANKKIYLSAAILGILTFLSIIFLISPLFKGIKKNSEELLLQRKKIILLSEEKENLKKLEEIYETHHSDLAKIENVFIDPDIPIDFINFLEAIAETSSVKLEISDLTKGVEEKDSLSLRILASGSFPNFSKFLEKLEAGPYLIEVLSLNARRLNDREIKSEELKGGSLGDTAVSLLIRVFTK